MKFTLLESTLGDEATEGPSNPNLRWPNLRWNDKVIELILSQAFDEKFRNTLASIDQGTMWRFEHINVQNAFSLDSARTSGCFLQLHINLIASKVTPEGLVDIMIVRVEADSVEVDMTHPLALKKLRYKTSDFRPLVAEHRPIIRFPIERTRSLTDTTLALHLRLTSEDASYNPTDAWLTEFSQEYIDWIHAHRKAGISLIHRSAFIEMALRTSWRHDVILRLLSEDLFLRELEALTKPQFTVARVGPIIIRAFKRAARP